VRGCVILYKYNNMYCLSPKRYNSSKDIVAFLTKQGYEEIKLNNELLFLLPKLTFLKRIYFTKYKTSKIENNTFTSNEAVSDRFLLDICLFATSIHTIKIEDGNSNNSISKTKIINNNDHAHLVKNEPSNHIKHLYCNIHIDVLFLKAILKNNHNSLKTIYIANSIEILNGYSYPNLWKLRTETSAIGPNFNIFKFPLLIDFIDRFPFRLNGISEETGFITHGYNDKILLNILGNKYRFKSIITFWLCCLKQNIFPKDIIRVITKHILNVDPLRWVNCIPVAEVKNGTESERFFIGKKNEKQFAEKFDSLCKEQNTLIRDVECIDRNITKSTESLSSLKREREKKIEAMKLIQQDVLKKLKM
jgi:hypothetical protein